MPPRRCHQASPETMIAGGANIDQLAQVLANVNLNRRTTFKLPKYDGSGDVELYLQQFVDISAANQWEKGASLLHLKCTLEVAAAACNRGETLDIIFQGLRARFGIGPRQARDKLGQLRYESNSSLHVLGAEVERFVDIAYPAAGQEIQNTLAIDSFTRALNHNALQRHLLVLQIESVADAVTAAQEYFQVENNSRKSKHHVASVEVDQVSVEKKSPMELVMEKMLQQMETNTKVVQQLLQQKPINTGRKWRESTAVRPADAGNTDRSKSQKSTNASKSTSPQNGNDSLLSLAVDGPNKELPRSSQVTEPTRINPSYFLPGKVSGRPVYFLIDSGCTSNIISQHVFERISKGVRDQLMPYESQGRLADGSQMEISGTIELSGRLRDIAFVSEFLVCPVTESAILGMLFLENNACVMDFRLQSLKMKGRELKCTNRFGDRLQSKVQVVHKVIIPSHSEMMVKGRLCGKMTNEVGVVDRWEENPKAAPGLLLGTCLAKVGEKLQVPIRCINITRALIVINAGSCVGMFHAVEVPSEGKVEIRQITDVLNKSSSRTGDHLSVDSMPEHIRSVYLEAIRLCTTDEERSNIGKLLEEFQDVFSRSDTDVGRTHLVEHSILVKPGTRPIKQQARRLGPEKEVEVERQLNSVTEQDCHPLPRIDESLDALAGSKIFSTLDLISGYWQLPLDEDAQDKSSFVTRDGLWKWRVLPFGLTSAPACFSRLMERVMRGLHWKTLLLYLNDIIVFSGDIDSNVERLAAVFERLYAAGLKLKPRKCKLFKAEVKYLGHVVSAEGVATNPEKIEDVKSWPIPKWVRELKAFLGTAECLKSFESLKQSLVTSEFLGYPDPSLPFILDTDASAEGIGGVLSQIQNGKERVISYYSKSFSPSERNYCVTRRELLAVIKCVKHFRPYLYGRQFLVRTDHASLI
ncbi:uncharacterized protein [Watersipora subatra]|uniref:uncharacterized protein n=1 Tax=Watersipora subatra TaxID=2589382 RepID=UPI00355B7AD3